MIPDVSRVSSGPAQTLNSDTIIGYPVVNSRLSQLQPYPFEKLRALLAGLAAGSAGRFRSRSANRSTRRPISSAARLPTISTGSRRIRRPPGHERVRAAIAAWFERRYALKALDPRTQVLPVNGTREALFAFGQAVVDPVRANPVVVSPNPFYQIYEGAALLAGAEPLFLNQTEEQRLRAGPRFADETAVARARSCCMCARRQTRRAAC